MTNGEAIFILDTDRAFLYGDDPCYNKQAYDLAIKSLEGEPKRGTKRVNNDANFDDNVAPFFCSECLQGVNFKDNFCWFCGADLKEE